MDAFETALEIWGGGTVLLVAWFLGPMYGEWFGALRSWATRRARRKGENR